MTRNLPFVFKYNLQKFYLINSIHILEIALYVIISRKEIAMIFVTYANLLFLKYIPNTYQIHIYDKLKYPLSRYIMFDKETVTT